MLHLRTGMSVDCVDAAISGWSGRKRSRAWSRFCARCIFFGAGDVAKRIVPKALAEAVRIACSVKPRATFMVTRLQKAGAEEGGAGDSSGVENQQGATDFCVRILDKDGNTVKHFAVSLIAEEKQGAMMRLGAGYWVRCAEPRKAGIPKSG